MPATVDRPPTPPHDTLSDVLGSVRLRGAVFYVVSFGQHWVAETPGSRELAEALMPGCEHVLAYHLMLRGAGWAALQGQPPARLAAGDIVMFPRGDHHTISSAPGMHAMPDDNAWRFETRHYPKPIAVAYHQGVLRPGAPSAVDGSSNVVVCGFVGCDLRPFNPLIDALPRLLHLGAGGVGGWVAPMLGQAVAESRQRRPGSAAVLERVSEMVFVDAARRYLESLPEGGGSGWLAALRDRHVGRAIGLMHAHPAAPWTLDDLGHRVGLSRSALHERFVELVGQPPMQYLAQWRMQRGAVLLRESQQTVAEVALEVGYDSQAAFARAFKRAVGQPPAAWRRAQRSSG
jgi:AraC-like DNA-binding protein